jgi:hypothetical protein
LNRTQCLATEQEGFSVKTAPGASLVLALAISSLSPSFAAPADGKNMAPTIVEQRFGNLRFSLPATFRLVDDTSEDTPPLIPGAPPTREHFRSYTSPDGQGLYLFHWEGSPTRDRGAMVAEQQWQVLIDGQEGLVSLTTTFFDIKQRVLTAHFAAPNGDRHLIYQKTKDPQQAPDRESFLAVLGTIRFQEAKVEYESDFIGTASMWPDGTIQLQLRAADGSGSMGDALLTYPKNHLEYQMILDHLDGLRPGEQKPIKPFPPKK